MELVRWLRCRTGRLVSSRSSFMLTTTLLLTSFLLATPVPTVAPGPGAEAAAGIPPRVAIFRTTAGGAGDVLLVDPDGLAPIQRPAGLQQVRLLPIEVNGRTELERLFPDRARRHADVPGASRIALPGRTGSLYHHARDEDEGTRFGYFVVDAAGDARVLIERNGTGPAGDQDPWLERVATAPDGLAFLAATVEAAGGDLFEVTLDGDVVARTRTLPAQPLQAGGLALTATWGIAATAQGVLRFDRTPLDQASPVPFPTTPAWFAGEVVTSRNGAHAVTIAGDDATAAHAFAFGPSGPAQRASPTPMPLSGAGFLPDALDGPHLAISDDGGTCAWRIDGPISREAFAARLDTQQDASTQITADAHFVDTLDEIGQFLFLPLSGTLVMAIGGVGNAPNTIEDLDYYAVTLAPDGTPVFANLTGTSGDHQPPFAGGSTIEPIGAALVPGTDRLVVYDEQGNNGPLLAIESSGSTTLADAVRELWFVERVGTTLVFGLERLVGGQDRPEVHVLAAGAGATQVVGSPGITGDLTDALAGPDGRVAFVLRVPMAEFVWVCNPSALTLDTLTARPLIYGPTLAFTSSGLLALTVGGPFGPTVKIGWDAPGAITRLPVGSGPGFVLPGGW
jgi:hypothetical protein